MTIFSVAYLEYEILKVVLIFSIFLYMYKKMCSNKAEITILISIIAAISYNPKFFKITYIYIF